ncbi:MAG TPA: hypothetical protein VIY48_05475 [Candidatus Paceibacterota bacterium]
MSKRVVVKEEKERPQTFARSLYDSTLPLDVVFSGAMAATQRPGILSERAELEEEKDNA